MAGWLIEGHYMETCNCTYLCRCPSSNLAARPTEGDCKAAIAMRIDKGQKDGVKLDGISFIVVLRSPGPMAVRTASTTSGPRPCPAASMCSSPFAGNNPTATPCCR